MSKKRYYNVTINGVDFILDAKETINETYLHGYNDIYNAYERPSRYKVGIWKDWEKWFTDNGGYCTISSRNCMQFTISGYFTDKETGARFYAYITKTYNRCYLVEGFINHYIYK